MKIPGWASWQSRDSRGRLWFWEVEPVLADYQGRQIWALQPGTRCKCCTEAGPIMENWPKTLVKL